MSGALTSAAPVRGDAEPSWLAALREKGQHAHNVATMPSPKDEAWKYVDLDFAVDDFRPASEPGGHLTEDAFLGSLSETEGLLTIVDGTVVDAHSDKVKVGRIAEDLDGGWARRYGSAVPPGLDIFAAANHASAPPGAVIDIPAGTSVGAPMVVDIQATLDGTSSFPHLVVHAGDNSEASVVLVYRSAPGADVLVCPIIEAWTGRGARLSITAAQNLGDAARLVAHHHFVTGRDSTLRIGELGLGGRYARQRLGISLDGMGSSVQMGGIYFGVEQQVMDYRIFVTHRGPRTTSDIFLKGAVADQARAVWTGLVRIENEAIGTSAFETNRNLVLSDGARVNSVPNLEILTDDLQCGHGSSSGPLDEGQLYYLMSRGLPRRTAERLLVRGFFDEVLSGFAVAELSEPARQMVSDRFAASQGRLKP